MTVDPKNYLVNQSVNNKDDDCALTKLTLALDPSASPAISTTPLEPTVNQQNPSSSPLTPQIPCFKQSHLTKMAYQRTDPAPFVPPRMHHVEVQNRCFMVRAVASSRPIPRHEDWVIVTIEPLSGIASMLEMSLMTSLRMKLMSKGTLKKENGQRNKPLVHLVTFEITICT
jgi:hypothetical protein